jgi:hypothetical protein
MNWVYLSYKKGSSISPLICWVAGVARFGYINAVPIVSEVQYSQQQDPR